MTDATVTDAGPYERLVSFELKEADLEVAKGAAARKISREVKIRGFRPGKAPRSIVEATVGAERIRSDAIDELLPAKVGDVLTRLAIDPAVPPSLESLDEADDGVRVSVKVTTWPTLDDAPEIHDRTVEIGSPDVTDDELQEQIDRFRGQFASVEEVQRAAGVGDYVSMDISATNDGVDVPEASAAGLLYEVGSGGLIEALDEALTGASAGDEVTFGGPLPDGFGENAGMDVVYIVSVNDVRESVLPDVTDEWVSETTEFESVHELRTTLLAQMTEMKMQSLSRTFQDRALDQLVEEVELELPEALVRSEMDEVFHRFSHRLSEQQISLEDYFQVTGIDQQSFIADLESQAERSLKTRLLLDAVIDSEGLEVSNDELGGVMDAVIGSSDNPERVRQALQEDAPRKNLVGDILRNKALEAIVQGARPVDDMGNEVQLVAMGPEPIDAVQVDSDQSSDDEVYEAEIVEAEVIASNEEE